MGQLTHGEGEELRVEVGPRSDGVPPAQETVRVHCRSGGSLDGADAQALEHALTITERERDGARDLVERWKLASGLECGGDPDGVMPEIAGGYWLKIQSLGEGLGRWMDIAERMAHLIEKACPDAGAWVDGLADEYDALVGDEVRIVEYRGKR